MKKNYVCSDVHAHAGVLKKALDTLDADDRLFMIGDAVDKGPDGMRALQILMDDPRCEMLIGNHDLMFLQHCICQQNADILPQIAAWETPDYAAVENCCAGLHSVESRDVLPTCTAAGQTGRVCGVCGQVLEPITPIPATGHADGDGDEVCDRCGAYLGEAPSLLQRLLAFFRRLAEFWRNLFRFGR